jgi:hypothetical protein
VPASWPDAGTTVRACGGTAARRRTGRRPWAGGRPATAVPPSGGLPATVGRRAAGRRRTCACAGRTPGWCPGCCRDPSAGYCHQWQAVAEWCGGRRSGTAAPAWWWPSGQGEPVCPDGVRGRAAGRGPRGWGRTSMAWCTTGAAAAWSCTLPARTRRGAPPCPGGTPRRRRTGAATTGEAGAVRQLPGTRPGGGRVRCRACPSARTKPPAWPAAGNWPGPGEFPGLCPLEPGASRRRSGVAGAATATARRGRTGR